MPGNVRPSHGQLVTADGADRGVHDGRIEAIARLHHIRSALMIALLADHRSDQGDRAHLLGQLLEALGKLDAAQRGLDCLGAAGGRCSGLGIERLELAGPTREPEQDQRPSRFPGMFRLPGQKLADGSQPAQPRQGEKPAAVNVRSRKDGHGSRPGPFGLNGSTRIRSC